MHIRRVVGIIIIVTDVFLHEYFLCYLGGDRKQKQTITLSKVQTCLFSHLAFFMFVLKTTEEQKVVNELKLCKFSFKSNLSIKLFKTMLLFLEFYHWYRYKPSVPGHECSALSGTSFPHIRVPGFCPLLQSDLLSCQWQPWELTMMAHRTGLLALCPQPTTRISLFLF